MTDHAPDVAINEYHNGNFFKQWDGIAECARSHAIGYDTLKCLIATGYPLYWQDAVTITFDTPADSPYRYEMVDDSNKNRKVPQLIVDVSDVVLAESNGTC